MSPEEYLQAQPDPLVAFAAPVLQHMNADHAESVAAMVAQFAGFPCSKAVMVAVDRLGFEVSDNYRDVVLRMWSRRNYCNQPAVSLQHIMYFATAKLVAYYTSSLHTWCCST